MTRILVYTCNEYAWCLRPFLYLLSVYWSHEQQVIIGGCEPFETGNDVEWLNVESRVKERWSDGLMECLQQIDDDIIVWLLDDYWLCRTVDCEGVESLADYMRLYPNILKIDLTADRLHSGAAVDVGYWGRHDLIETPWDTPYQHSTQAGLWRRKLLLSCLRQEMSPWDFELQDRPRPELRVLGTRNYLVRYCNGLGTGLESRYRYRTDHIRDGLGGKTIERIAPEHVERMLELGILPPQEKDENQSD